MNKIDVVDCFEVAIASFLGLAVGVFAYYAPMIARSLLG